MRIQWFDTVTEAFQALLQYVRGIHNSEKLHWEHYKFIRQILHNCEICIQRILQKDTDFINAQRVTYGIISETITVSEIALDLAFAGLRNLYPRLWSEIFEAALKELRKVAGDNRMICGDDDMARFQALIR